MKYSELNPRDPFEVWGDQFLNYGHHRICRCEKIDDLTAREIIQVMDGIPLYGAPFVIASDATVMPVSNEAEVNETFMSLLAKH
jgi:hypothetical protein